MLIEKNDVKIYLQQKESNTAREQESKRDLITNGNLIKAASTSSTWIIQQMVHLDRSIGQDITYRKTLPKKISFSPSSRKYFLFIENSTDFSL